MSRASRRARGRQIEAARLGVSDDTPTASGTRQIGALRIGPDNALAVDPSKLDAPTRAYDADCAWIEYRPGNVSLLFAKKSRDEANVLHSRLEIRYPAEDLVTTFWGISSNFFEKLRVYVKRWPQEAQTTEAPPTNLPAKQSHSEWASLTYISHSGSDAALDFYYLPAPAIARYVQTRSVEGLKFHPVVRVQLTTFELLSLIDRVGPVVEEIVRSLPDQHRPELEKVE